VATTLTTTHAFIAADFSLHTVTVSAESVDGSTPGARVTWSTTVPPECVASVTVEFRNGSSHSGGSVVRSYTTTNTSQTEVIQTGLQCFAFYYIRVVVAGVLSLGVLESNEVFVGGIIFNRFYVLFTGKRQQSYKCLLEALELKL